MCRLEVLPEDIFYLVAASLESEDIWALQEACSCVGEVSRSYTVWCGTLLRSLGRRIPKPFYLPLPLNLCSPAVLENAVRNWEAPWYCLPKSANPQVFNMLLPEDSESGFTFKHRNACLLPGGRWLVISMEDASVWYCDLDEGDGGEGLTPKPLIPSPYSPFPSNLDVYTNHWLAYDLNIEIPSKSMPDKEVLLCLSTFRIVVASTEPEILDHPPQRNQYPWDSDEGDDDGWRDTSQRYLDANEELTQDPGNQSTEPATPFTQFDVWQIDVVLDKLNLKPWKPLGLGPVKKLATFREQYLPEMRGLSLLGGHVAYTVACTHMHPRRNFRCANEGIVVVDWALANGKTEINEVPRWILPVFAGGEDVTLISDSLVMIKLPDSQDMKVCDWKKEAKWTTKSVKERDNRQNTIAWHRPLCAFRVDTTISQHYSGPLLSIGEEIRIVIPGRHRVYRLRIHSRDTNLDPDLQDDYDKQSEVRVEEYGAVVDRPDGPGREVAGYRQSVSWNTAGLPSDPKLHLQVFRYSWEDTGGKGEAVHGQDIPCVLPRGFASSLSGPALFDEFSRRVVFINSHMLLCIVQL